MIDPRLASAALVLFACTPEAGESRGPAPLVDAAPSDTGSLPSEADAGEIADASADARLAVDAAAAADAGPPDADPCATPRVESWSGTASRDNEIGYPDHITATITWQRTGTEGCVDHYAPVGVATYGYAIPGALCAQSIDPDTHSIDGSHGSLTIDRTTSPATYDGRGETYWSFVFHCEFEDGTYEESTMDGGAIWFDAGGEIAAGTISGSYLVAPEDQGATERCGPNGIAPCTYSWSFGAD